MRRPKRTTRRIDTGRVFKAAGIDSPDKYAKLFQGRIFVVKCGGSLLENPETGAAVLDDLAVLYKSGIRPILVHGGSVQADSELKAAGIAARRVRGLRVTCDRTLDIISTCFNRLNGVIVDELRARGVEAEGFGRGQAVAAERMTVDGKDIGNVGLVTGVDEKQFTKALKKALPVVASLGTGPDGGLLNINADYVATGIALHLKAEKLILLTDVLGVMTDPRDETTLIPTLTKRKARALIKSGVIAAGMIPKVESAVDAVKNGLPKVHMINGRLPHALLLEVFTDGGCGTQVVP